MEKGYQVIARRWRPQQFSELVGQDHIVRTLSNAIEQNRIAHAYLFVGPRGTGKTSTARLFAKALNAEGGPSVNPDNDSEMSRSIMEGNCMDVIEIDGASNNSVEDVRNLREECQYAPSQGRYKVYIIDEVHMLSTQAFNALLKTLEEPPPHVKFIFATTESHKVLSTIVSRCQRFEFRPIPEGLIVGKLKEIGKKEGIEVEESALIAIARLARGGMRDSQSILDQMISFCGNQIAESDVLDVYGLASLEQIRAMGQALAEYRYGDMIKQVEELTEEGRDLLQVLQGLQDYFRQALLKRLHEKKEEGETALSLESLMRILDVLREGEYGVQKGLSQRVNFEITLLKAAEQSRSRPVDSLIRQIAQITESLPREAELKKKSATEITSPEEATPEHPEAVEEPEADLDALEYGFSEETAAGYPVPEKDAGAEEAVTMESPVAEARELTDADLQELERRMGPENLKFLKGELRGEWMLARARESRPTY